MKGLGQKLNSQVKGLGVKSKSLVFGLGNKQAIIPHSISNIITPNKPIVAGLNLNQLIPNSSNTNNIQYLPTGLKQSNLEKRKR